MSKDILICAIDRWTAIWGDPVLSGTVFMLAYGVAALLAFRVARIETGDSPALWRLCAWLLVFQVANTHLDLHAFPGSLGRCLARAHGWYDQRAVLQVMALISVVTLLALLLLWVLVRFRAAFWPNILLTVGMILSLGFTLIRGLTLHSLDALYARNVGTLPLSYIVEMTGILLVVVAALLRLRAAHLRPSL